MLLSFFASLLVLCCHGTSWLCSLSFVWMWRRRHTPMPKAQVAPIRRRRAAVVAKPHWRSNPEATRKHILYLAIHTKLSSRRIEDHLRRLTSDPQLIAGKSWIAELLSAHADEIKAKRLAMRQRMPAIFAVGHTWAMDLTFLVDAQGLSFTMLGILDHGSRRLLCLKELPRKCTLTLLGHLFLTMARFGMPSVVRTDNESMFASAL